MVVVFLGQLLLALAGALVIRRLFRDVPPIAAACQRFDLVAPVAYTSCRLLLVFLLFIFGLAIFPYGFVAAAPRAPGALPVARSRSSSSSTRQRFLARGPRIVAIGGGTGLSVAAPRPQGAEEQHHRGRDGRR